MSIWKKKCWSKCRTYHDKGDIHYSVDWCSDDAFRFDVENQLSRLTDRSSKFKWIHNRFGTFCVRQKEIARYCAPHTQSSVCRVGNQKWSTEVQHRLRLSSLVVVWQISLPVVILLFCICFVFDAVFQLITNNNNWHKQSILGSIVPTQIGRFQRSGFYWFFFRILGISTLSLSRCWSNRPKKSITNRGIELKNDVR